MANYSAFADVEAPTVANSETIGVNLATEFVCQPGWLIGYRFVRPTVATTGPFSAAFYATATGTADPDSIITGITPAGVGWIDVLLPEPVHYAAEIRARATVHHPSGRYAFQNNAFALDGTFPSGRTNGPVYAPHSLATANGQGLFLAGASIAMPTNMFDETFYYVDVIWSDEDPAGREGTGATTATATLAGAGSKATAGTGDTTATGALASTGHKTGRGTGALTATSGLTGTGHKDATGTAGTTATAALAATGTPTRSGTGSLTATAGLAATGQAHRTGTGALTATATLASNGHDPDDAVTAPQFTVGAPHTRWNVGAPRTG